MHIGSSPLMQAIKNVRHFLHRARPVQRESGWATKGTMGRTDATALTYTVFGLLLLP